MKVDTEGIGDWMMIPYMNELYGVHQEMAQCCVGVAGEEMYCLQLCVCLAYVRLFELSKWTHIVN